MECFTTYHGGLPEEYYKLEILKLALQKLVM